MKKNGTHFNVLILSVMILNRKPASRAVIHSAVAQLDAEDQSCIARK